MTDRVTLFFSAGFRPFFLGAALWATMGMALWMPMFGGELAGEFHWSVVDWHVHEMLFGYASAVIAGFLLTAVPNWTGIAAPKGLALAALFALWIAGRLAVFLSMNLPVPVVAAIDLSFLITLDIWLVRTLLAANNRRNLVVAGLIGLIILSDAAMYVPALVSFGKGLGLLGVLLLVSLIGGRVIPAFTRNWLRSEGDDHSVPEFGMPDKLAIGSTIVAMSLFTLDIGGVLATAFFALAALTNFLRLSRWQGTRTAAEPLVTILHIAYLWIPVGFFLLAVAQLHDRLSINTALHALTTGAIGTITLAVMTRASLGHSGQALKASRATVGIYVLITLSALLRVSADMFPDPVTIMTFAGLCWILSFGLFATFYGRLFLGQKNP